MRKQQTGDTAVKSEKYRPGYDEDYIRKKMEASASVWSGVNADEYVRSVREGVYEG